MTNSENTSVTNTIGEHTGQVKWFNNTRGYGFITVHGDSAVDVFVHQTNINPTLSTFRSLVEGEYVSLDISTDDKKQALNVQGINGGSLRCDSIQQRKDAYRKKKESQSSGDQSEEQSNSDRHSRRGRGRGRGRGRRSGRQPGRGNTDDTRRPRGTNLTEYIPSDAVPAVSQVADENDTGDGFQQV